MQKKIAYVFRGSPSSGKGTLTTDFIKMLPGKVAKLELDEFRWAFHLFNRTPQDVTDDEHLFAYRNFLLMLENYCQNGGYTLVIEGLFSAQTAGPHGMVGDITDILEKYGFEYKLILLTAPYETLRQRNLKRAYAVPEKEFKELYAYVNDADVPGETHLDVSGTLEDTLNVLKKLVYV